MRKERPKKKLVTKVTIRLGQRNILLYLVYILL